MVYVAIDRRVLPEGATKLTKILSPARRLLMVLAVVLPAVLLAPGIASAAPPAEPDFAIPTDLKVNTEFTFEVKDPDATLTYTWDTDGNEIFGTEAKVSYATTGEKSITLRATENDPGADGVRESSEITKKFSVSEPTPDPPVADFSISNRRPMVGEEITLSSQSTGTLKAYAWTANGGAPLIDDAGASSTTISFGEPGTWQVRLEVTDDLGRTAARTRSIQVSTQPPPPNKRPNIPSFDWTPTRPTVGEVVKFTATATDPDPGGTIETIEWDFDNDGVIDASGNPVQRVFTRGGTATVVVTVTDDRGDKNSSFQTITVDGPSSANGNAASQGNTTNAPTGSNVGPVGVGNTPNTTGNTKTTLRRINAIIRLRGAFLGSQTRITLLQVSGVPRGAKVRARCRGGGCPKGLVTSTAQTSGRTIRLRTFERRLSVGATIEVYVTRTGRLGKYTRWRIARGKAPLRSDKCVRSFGGKTSTCPPED